MKKNSAVLKRVEKYRERRGIRIIDQKSKLYLISKVMYITSFAWFILFHLFYVIGIGVALSASTVEHPIKIIANEVYVIIGTTVAMTVGFVLVLLKKHLAGGIINLIVLPVDVYQFYVLLILKGREIDSMTKFIWRHLVPSVLMLVFCTILCVIAFRVKALLNRDYKRVLEALYITHKERLGSGSEEEWEELLSELSDDELENELDRQHTREYKNKK